MNKGQVYKDAFVSLIDDILDHDDVKEELVLEEFMDKDFYRYYMHDILDIEEMMESVCP